MTPHLFSKKFISIVHLFYFNTSIYFNYSLHSNYYPYSYFPLHQCADSSIMKRALFQFTIMVIEFSFVNYPILLHIIHSFSSKYFCNTTSKISFSQYSLPYNLTVSLVSPITCNETEYFFWKYCLTLA